MLKLIGLEAKIHIYKVEQFNLLQQVILNKKKLNSFLYQVHVETLMASAF